MTQLEGPIDGIKLLSPAMRLMIANVRAFLRDFPELNRLVDGAESSTRQIAWAILDALSDFNGTPPLGGATLEDLLQRGQQHLLTRMAALALLESVGLLQTRNHLSYATGGTTVGVSDKTPLIMKWLDYFRTATEQKKVKVKIAMNIESILGPANRGVFSEYWATHATYALY